MFKFVRLFIAVTFLFVLVFGKSSAQTGTADYKNNPEWIKMIDNPNTNYYEAQKAYDTYWKYHEKPIGEEEEMEMNAGRGPADKMTDKEKKEAEEKKREHEKEMVRESKKKLSEKDLLKLEEKREMTYQCKRFENWMLEVKPFVQNDGRILSQQERMEIYNKQLEEQQKQNIIK